MISRVICRIGMMAFVGVACLFDETCRAWDVPVSAEDEIREVYLRQRAQEKADAEQAVAELTQKDLRQMTHEDYIRLFRAYNELGPALPALHAIKHVPEAYLAKHDQLGCKVTAFHNANFPYEFNGLVFFYDGGPQIPESVSQELLFYDRCIDRCYGNIGEWYWRKARLLCRMSVRATYSQFSSSTLHEVVNREQFEVAFETLRLAFEVEPNLLQLDSLQTDLMFSGSDFPLLKDEPRYKQLIEQYSEEIPADAEAALNSPQSNQ